MRQSGIIVLAMLGMAVPAAAQAPDAELTRVKEHELSVVRQRISELKARMDASARQRDRLAAELEAADLEIARQREKLADIEERKRDANRRKAALDDQLAASRKALDEETGALAAQVRAAYLSGGQERLRLLLNQRDPAALGRLMVYYRYLNARRAATVAGVRARVTALNRVVEAIAVEQQRLADLADERYAELTTLGAAQDSRSKLMAELRREMDQQGKEVERLAQQEQDLTRLIAELTSILSDYPISSEEPFSELKGRLTWPIAGTLLHDFGQPRAGGDLKWNGVVLAAPRGREVRAVYHGRVAFADWLAGMGLLVIVDHGEGFMTLYGYNETVLKDAGDWVAPGDVIATVGESGGQNQAGLYFELRRGTRPIDPADWVKRRPGG